MDTRTDSKARCHTPGGGWRKIDFAAAVKSCKVAGGVSRKDMGNKIKRDTSKREIKRARGRR